MKIHKDVYSILRTQGIHIFITFGFLKNPGLWSTDRHTYCEAKESLPEMAVLTGLRKGKLAENYIY